MSTRTGDDGPDPMRELTAYFITTDRVTAPAAYATLERQGLANPIVVVRNVRPLAAAYRHALACETEYCLLLDDDVALRDGVAREAMVEFEAQRAADPGCYSLVGSHFTDGDDPVGGGGFKLFHAPSLRQVGFPDAPHVHVAQSRVAERLGLRLHPSALHLGAHLMGSPLDCYKRYLWLQLRWNAGQLRHDRRPRVLELLRKAQQHQTVSWWLAVLGTMDAALVGVHATSKDEDFLGPLARGLDFDRLTARDVEALCRRSTPRWARAWLPIWSRITAGRVRGRLRRELGR